MRAIGWLGYAARANKTAMPPIKNRGRPAPPVGLHGSRSCVPDWRQQEERCHVVEGREKHARDLHPTLPAKMPMSVLASSERPTKPNPPCRGASKLAKSVMAARAIPSHFRARPEICLSMTGFPGTVDQEISQMKRHRLGPGIGGPGPGRLRGHQPPPLLRSSSCQRHFAQSLPAGHSDAPCVGRCA